MTCLGTRGPGHLSGTRSYLSIPLLKHVYLGGHRCGVPSCLPDEGFEGGTAAALPAIFTLQVLMIGKLVVAAGRRSGRSIGRHRSKARHLYPRQAAGHHATSTAARNFIARRSPRARRVAAAPDPRTIFPISSEFFLGDWCCARSENVRSASVAPWRHRRRGLTR